MIDHDRINNTLGKMAYYLGNHESICVGVSGGSDSNIIVHMIATYFREHLPKVHFVFQNTGLEYRATLRHIDWMENHYDIHIDRIRPAKGDNVVSVVRREGLPIVSKEYSEIVNGASRGVPNYVKKLNLTKSESQYAFSKNKKDLAMFIIKNNIKVSNKCCNLSKKKPFHKYLKQVNADLSVSGERQCEGGQRSSAHKNCFEPRKDVDKYMPLWFWNDETKQYYKESEGIRYSDCYEVYGKKRTGCVGCPYNSRAGKELKLIQKYEPQLYKACMNVFGESYRLMDKFDIHRHKILEED